MAISILIVEDESIIALNLKVWLSRLGYHVLPLAHSGDKGIALAQEYNPDLLIMDIMLQGTLNGLETARIITEFSEASIIYLTGNDHMVREADMSSYPPGPVLSKPVTEQKLLHAMDTLLIK